MKVKYIKRDCDLIDPQYLVKFYKNPYQAYVKSKNEFRNALRNGEAWLNQAIKLVTGVNIYSTKNKKGEEFFHIEWENDPTICWEIRLDTREKFRSFDYFKESIEFEYRREINSEGCLEKELDY